MKLFQIMILISMLFLPITPVLAQEEKNGNIKDTVGLMTEPVILARLKSLGYSKIHITHTDPLRYRIDAVKKGKPTVLELHPQTGEVREITRGKVPGKPWMMPIQPALPKEEKRRD